MLQNIHDKAKGWVAYLIVGFIAIPFTLFGISSYLGGSSSLVAATVNGEEIPVQDVQNAVSQQRQRLTQMFGGKLPPGFDGNAIKKQALEQAVSQVLLRQESDKFSYRVSNSEVLKSISEIPAFQVNGKFDVKTYERLLASQRRNKANFESDLRKSLSNEQFVRAMSNAAFLPKNEVTRFQALQNQTRSAETYALKKSDYLSEVSVSDEEVKSYFDENAKQFMTPEKVKLSYVELKQSDLAKNVTVTDEALQSFYDENADRYTDPEQRKLAHILIKIDSDSDPKEAEKKAKERADTLYSTISSGEKTFEDVASNDSDDKFSAKKSGEIGLIVRGDMGPAFEKVAFSLKKGEISKPVKAEAGYEIIKLLDVIDSTQKSFAEVKSEIEELYRKEQASKLFFDNSDKLQTLAFENESSLDAAADAVGLLVKSSDWINKGAVSTKKDLFASPKLLAAAFSDDVLTQGKNSELLEIDDQTVAVIRVQDHEQPKQKSIEKVSDQIKDILKNQKLRKVLVEKGESALKQLKESGDWSSALALIGGSVDKIEKNDNIKRTESKLNPTIVGKIFSMKKPEEGKPSFDNVILPEGDYILIKLDSVKDGAVEKVEPSIKSKFTQIISSREQSAMLKALREAAEVELFLENIQ